MVILQFFGGIYKDILNVNKFLNNIINVEKNIYNHKFSI